MHESEEWKWSRSVVSNLQRPKRTAAYQAPPSMGFFQARILERGCHWLLQKELRGVEILVKMGDSKQREILKIVNDSITTPKFSLVQSLSCVRLFATPLTAAWQASLSITNSRSSPKPMSIESVMPSKHLILCHPLLFLPSMFPSIRVFSNESALHIRWPKYWSFSFNISPSNEDPGLISFRMDWLDLRSVQGTLKSLLQHHSSKA